MQTKVPLNTVTGFGPNTCFLDNERSCLCCSLITSDKHQLRAAPT